jgi:UDP-N-acetylmuramoyl-L-alanyl-D-glutamate--2,6-diaminopimelate ligase
MMTAEAMSSQHCLSGLLRGFPDVSVKRDANVSGIALDSRKVQAGDLFLAVAGTQTHGLQFARQALALGAVAVAWEPVADHAGLAEIAGCCRA